MREEAEIVPIENNSSRKCQPQVSVSLLGAFRLEWHVPSAGEDNAWKSRTSARSLFKLLLCVPNRQATRSQLVGILWPEADEHNARESLRSAIKVLRRVLRPGGGEELLETRDSEIVKLADQSRLFVDVDAFEMLVQQAGHMTDQRAAFPLWIQARELVQGEFLADERTSEWMHCRWIKVRRQLLRAARRRMIRSLADLYIQSGQEARAEELLHEHAIRFPTDQDALYRLMQLLIEAECFDEARAYYEQGKAALALLGKQPADHLKALETFLFARGQDRIDIWRTKQIERTTITPLDTIERLQGLPANQQQHLPSLEKRLSSHRSIGAQPPLLHTYQRLVEARSGDPLDAEALVACASFFASLLEQGWSLDALFQTLRNVLPIVKAIQMITRRQFLQTSATTLMGSIAFLHSTHITEEDRSRLCQVLSESITEGWHLFGSSSNTQVLALGQIQLFLLQQIHALLYPVVLPFLYTGAYSLIGIALHFQERDQEALQAHQHGYIAAVATGEPWYVAQSLICQSDCYHALGQYNIAIQWIEEALRTLGDAGNPAQIGAKAHLLTCWADTAMMLKDYRTAQEKLEASAAYLDHIVPNEEFDRAAWHLLAGKYRLVTKGYASAVDHFKESLALLPGTWTLRRAMTSLGLIKAYARVKERDQSLMVADEVVPMVQTINARVTNRWLHEYIQHDLLSTFPTDERVRTFVKDTYKRLPQLADSVPD